MHELPPTPRTPEQPLERIVRIDLNSTETYKKESEDASFVDPVRDIFIAADGITRGPYENKNDYPDPSPAAAVAKATVEAIGQHLASVKDVQEQDLREAARMGSEAARYVNEQSGLWQNPDYLKRDLAGTVVSGLVRKGNDVLYLYIGDCGLAVLKADGTISWQSPDEITPIRPHFPKAEAVGTNERFIRVRRDFRNKPDAKHPTYGAFTGEPEALSYVRVGTLHLEPGDVAVAHTDGITPFLQDPVFRKLVASGSKEAITSYLNEKSTNSKHSDDKTLLISREAYKV